MKRISLLFSSVNAFFPAPGRKKASVQGCAAASAGKRRSLPGTFRPLCRKAFSALSGKKGKRRAQERVTGEKAMPCRKFAPPEAAFPRRERQGDSLPPPSGAKKRRSFFRPSWAENASFLLPEGTAMQHHAASGTKMYQNKVLTTPPGQEQCAFPVPPRRIAVPECGTRVEQRKTPLARIRAEQMKTPLARIRAEQMKTPLARTRGRRHATH